MLFKTYQKLLGASCLALYLAGCGGGESPIEMKANSDGGFQISSKVDSVTIQGVKLNRGNCVVNFVPVEAMVLMGVLLRQITLISMQDFKDAVSFYENDEAFNSAYEYNNHQERLANIENKISQLKQKGLMMEPQTLEFGEKIEGFSKGCDIMEAEIQTNKGTWTFNFDR